MPKLSESKELTRITRKEIDLAANATYRNNREPLRPLKLIRLPLGAIRPQGWLRHQLDLMLEGMTGRLDEISEFLQEDNGWFQDGNPGWEEQPYWLRGCYALAVLTNDEQLLSKAQHWIERVIASQKNDGWFGSRYHQHRAGSKGRSIADLWPHMVMCDALRLHYDYTQDDRVIHLLSRFFSYCQAIPEDEFIPLVEGEKWQEYREDFGDWKVGVQMKRAGEMLPHIYWLYSVTGDEPLLALATRFYEHILPPVSEFLDIHVVNFTQRYGYPGIYGQQSNLAVRIAESEYWYQQHMSVWGQQPRGAYGADEMIRSGKTDPSQGMETCAMVEFALKFYELGRLTGKSLYADRCEDLFFNHFPAAQTPDLKGLHYLTASNLPQLDHGSGHDFWNEEQARQRGEAYPMLSYSPHRYRCCQHNVAMGWPYFAQHLWQKTGDGGLAAWIYGASEVEALVGENQTVHLSQKTNYPFDGHIRIEVQSGDAEFPLYLRIPAWCNSSKVSVNGVCWESIEGEGDYICIERKWVAGDAVELNLEMSVSQTNWPRTGAITVDRGPLSYSVRIEEEWRQCGGTNEWPEWEVYPRSSWNYGLVTSEGGDVVVDSVTQSKTLADQPWTVDNSPIQLSIKAKLIENWTLEPGGSPQDLRKSPIRSASAVESIQMIPLGCARLRMSCLPEVNESPEAKTWCAFKDC